MNFHGYAHHDLKPDNVLIEGRTSKAADFGTTLPHNETQHLQSWDAVSPERLTEVAIKLNLSQKYPQKSDAFGLGGIIYFIFQGDYYYNSAGKIQGDFESRIPRFMINELQDLCDSAPITNPFFKNMVGLLLQPDPAKRMALDTALTSLLEHRETCQSGSREATLKAMWTEVNPDYKLRGPS